MDRLSPALRHFLIVAVLPTVAAILLHVGSTVVQTGDVYAVDWSAEMRASVNAAALALFSGLATWVGLYLTPLTRQYGVGERVADPDEGLPE